MATRVDVSWVVLKFGGTSVSTAANWQRIAQIVRQRSLDGTHVLIVHSALSGITDRLERLLEGALAGAHTPILDDIENRHRVLAADLGVAVGDTVQRHFDDLRQLAAGVALVREVSARTRARVMSTGELMATELGAAYLRAQGLDVRWADARRLLRADEREGASAKARALSATCEFAPDDGLARELAAASRIAITQGFIASDGEGHTVLLGRGGSDTSAAYFAAKLRAQRLEIWTDVPGMFSANPRMTPAARLLKALHYDEAQEIATSGAKVLHPRCILPVRQYGIPLSVHDTHHPDLVGTVISAQATGGPQVKAVCVKKGVTLVSLDSPGMWHQVGFLADAFQIFKAHGLSVDLVSTSETSVTVSLDPAANTLDSDILAALVEELSGLCRVQVIGPCASVSLVGRNIRGILHRLGDAFDLFEEQRIYLVSQAANDLNFTFVVDEDQADRLVNQMHELLVQPVHGDPVLGPTWEQLFARGEGNGAPALAPWWRTERAALLAALGTRDAAYVYHGATVESAAHALKGLRSISRAWYAMKANSHPDVVRRIHATGIGLECVSRGEIEHAKRHVPLITPAQILYTPNFASRDEYVWALGSEVLLTIDSLYPLQHWAELFRGRDLYVRVDSGTGRGHHHHVRTAGAHAKFGVPVEELGELAALARAAGARIVGLHAHPGSGIFDVESWRHTALLLAGEAARFPDLCSINVGGGLGVPDHSDRPALDLARLDAVLADVKQAYPALEIWLEPGRFLVAAAGVLLARVTQTKRKGEVQYVGVATGMNSLIRPALYGAYHEIVNLTRLDGPATEVVNVVGPICESADVLGHDRLLPATEEGDVLLLATAGAYGHVMSSNYNLREPAEELLL
ncbi:MAG: bifunctional aspartate kinase/diaminopimelate decarboxylase [Steroidobacteraceae bacterium]